MNAAELLNSITIEQPRKSAREAEYDAALGPIAADLETRETSQRKALRTTVLPEVQQTAAALKAKYQEYLDAKYARTAATASVDRLFEQCFNRVREITRLLTTDLDAISRVCRDVEQRKYLPGSGVGTPASDPIGIMRGELLRYRRLNLAEEIAEMQIATDRDALELKTKIERLRRTVPTASAAHAAQIEEDEPMRRQPRRRVIRDDRDGGLVDG